MMDALIESWFTQDRVVSPTIDHSAYYRPIGESISPPWKKAWLVGEGHFKLTFFQPQKRDVHILLRYDGDLPLELDSISIYRDTYEDI